MFCFEEDGTCESEIDTEDEIEAARKVSGKVCYLFFKSLGESCPNR